MPNPFVNPLQKVTSTKPQERPIEPLPESYAGFNHPYRGVENHGVDSEYEIDPPTYHGDNDEDYEPADKVIPPIPVKVVTESVTEWRKITTLAGTVYNTKAIQLVGRDIKRKRLTVSVLATSGANAIVRIGNTADSIELNGYAIVYNGSSGTITLDTTEPVYISVAGEDSATYNVLIEYIETV